MQKQQHPGPGQLQAAPGQLGREGARGWPGAWGDSEPEPAWRRPVLPARPGGARAKSNALWNPPECTHMPRLHADADGDGLRIMLAMIRATGY